MTKIVIATRESPLALWQANRIKSLINQSRPDLGVELLGITTEGDKTLGTSLTKIGGKGLFVKELEQAMLNGEADLAVHSMKDVPIELPPQFCITAILEREEVRDAFISNRFGALDNLPAGSVIGTSSLRRESQIRRRYPNLKIRPLRGNVQTRLKKLDDGSYDGIVLAAAGLRRLGLSERIASHLDVDVSIPAAGQGALGIECLSSRDDIHELVAPLDDKKTRTCVEMERTISRRLGGSCTSPIGAYARFSGDVLKMDAFVSSPDGKNSIRVSGFSDERHVDGMRLGGNLADELVTRGALDVIEKTKVSE